MMKRKTKKSKKDDIDLLDQMCENCIGKCDCECGKEDCSICYNEYKLDEFRILENCGHKMCQECCVKQIKAETKVQIFPPRCPMCRGGIGMKDIKGALPEKVFVVYEYLWGFNEIKKDDDFFPCRTRNCRNGVLLVDGVGRLWKCDRCRHQYCLKCRRESHTESCEEYKQWLIKNNLMGYVVKELFQLGKLKRCPQCRIYSHRIGLSRDMRCEECSTSWCWHCIRKRADCRCRLMRKNRMKMLEANGVTKKIRKNNEIAPPPPIISTRVNGNSSSSTPLSPTIVLPNNYFETTSNFIRSRSIRFNGTSEITPPTPQLLRIPHMPNENNNNNSISKMEPNQVVRGMKMEFEKPTNAQKKDIRKVKLLGKRKREGDFFDAIENPRKRLRMTSN